MPPNKIDWDKVSLAELLNNPLVFSVVCGIFGLYFLLVLWARRADRKDLEKVPRCLLTLEDVTNNNFALFNVLLVHSTKCCSILKRNLGRRALYCIVRLF